jgi:hypothetical protein
MSEQTDLFGATLPAAAPKVEDGIVLNPAKRGPAGNLAANTTGIALVRDALFKQTDDFVEVEIYTAGKVFVLCITPQKAREFSWAFAHAADQVDARDEAA